MFLLFNNYGWSREASRQEGNFANVAVPVPIAFSFMSQDAYPTLVHTGGQYLVTMELPWAKMERVDDQGNVTNFTDGAPHNIHLKMNCDWHGASDELRLGAVVTEQTAINGNVEYESTQTAPAMCLFVPGFRQAAEFMSDNYRDIRAESVSRGLVHRVRNRISQHLCAPILNPDMRLRGLYLTGVQQSVVRL